MKPREFWLNKYTCEFHIGKLSDDDIHVIEYSAFEAVTKELAEVKNSNRIFDELQEACRVKINEVIEERDRYKTALENIKKHQEYSIVGNYKISTVWTIANEALKEQINKIL